MKETLILQILIIYFLLTNYYCHGVTAENGYLHISGFLPSTGDVMIVVHLRVVGNGSFVGKAVTP